MKMKALIITALLPVYLIAQSNNDGPTERRYCVEVLTKIADPVLTALSRDELKKKMPVEAEDAEKRKYSTHLEAMGRLLAGMAPWLELGPDDSPEGKLRKKYADLALLSIKNAVDPKAADFMNFNKGQQPLVDAAFFAQALLRSPNVLWGGLSKETQANVIAALKSSRAITPSYSNWLMFSATIEAALKKFDNSADRMRIDYALRQHELWYKGDGMYGDGPDFHFDYYNSFVIQPMLLGVCNTFIDSGSKMSDKALYATILSRAQRYAVIQERLISPEATFPAVGRSLAYRFGAFQLLATVALMHQLPKELQPQQVRAALVAVIKRQVEMPGTFDAAGWLQIGFAGHQPGIGENYISTGSLYLCSEGLVMLGLPPTDEFWQGKDLPWTEKKAWAGEEIPLDHALKSEP